MNKVDVFSSAYLKIQLHAIKYHAFDCIGLLVGKKHGGVTEVRDAIPLFHQRIQTGMLEVAFDMIESCHLPSTNGCEIVGIYEAAHPSTVGAKEISPLASYLCEQINDQLSSKGGVFLCIKPDQQSANDERTLNETLTNNTTGLQIKHFQIGNTNGSIQVIPDDKVVSDDNKYKQTSYVLENYVQDEARTYLKFADFDDHLADLAHDWRNPEFNIKQSSNYE